MELNVIEKTLRPKYYNKQKNLTRKYIAISPETYFTWIYTVDSKYCSEWEKLKIQHTNKKYSRQRLTINAISFYLFYKYGLKMLGYLETNRPKYKLIKISLGFVGMQLVGLVLSLYPFRNKDFYELITQPEPRGSYLRTHFKSNRPRVWSLVSKQLSEQGFNFKEMHEYSDNKVMPDIITGHDDNLY